MGRNASKPELDEIKNRYEVVSRDDNNNLTYLVDKRTNKGFMLKELFANDEASIRNIESQLVRKKHLRHQHLAELKQYYINLSEQFCSRMYSSGALYELPIRTLQDQRIERVKHHVHFDENELWSILASAILGFSYLQRNYIQHQTVRADNIFVDTEGTIKISDPYAKQLPINYELFRQSRNINGVYLSPAELRSFREQFKYATHNPYKSDVFSFGVVMLELAFLEEQNQLYSKNKGLLNEQLLRERQQKFGLKYSNEIKEILVLMMAINETERMDWIQLQGFFRGHSKGTKKPVNQMVSKRQSQFKPMTSQSSQRKLPISSMVNHHEHYKMVSSSPNIKQKKDTPIIHFQSPTQNVQMSPVPQVIHNPVDIRRVTPVQRQVRISEPPRLHEDINHPSQNGFTPQRPPTQHIPGQHVVSFFQPHEQIQQAYIKNMNNSSHGSQNSQVISVNKSPNSSFMVQNPVHIMKQQPAARLQRLAVPQIVPVAIMEAVPHRTSQQNSKRISQLETLDISKAEPLFSSKNKTKSPAALSSRESALNDMALRVESRTPKAKEQNSSQPFVKLKSNQPSKLDIQCMVVSEIDKPNEITKIPKEIYVVQTKPDENTRDAQYEADEKSFFSESSQVTMKERRATQSNYPEQLNQFMSCMTVHNNEKVNRHQSQKTLNNPDSTSQVTKTIIGRSKDNPTKIREEDLVFVKETYKQGSRYEGQKYKGMRHGQGRFYYDDGGMYQGTWNHNRMEGYGRLFYVDGRIAYQGNWSKDHFNGHGKLHNENPQNVVSYDCRSFDNVEDFWQTYEGQFKNDLRWGNGKLTLSNGQCYQGQFSNDMVHGKGIWKGKQETVRGLWQNNELVSILN